MNINYLTYVTELSNHFNKMAHLVTEDLIRYWFIITQKLSINETKIEKPYRLLKIKIKLKNVLNNKARADLYYNNRNEQIHEDVVIEFKYHKKSPYSNTAKSTNMGEVFRDLNRLSCLNNKEKYFIYVFDQEMKDYYDNYVFDILKVDTNKGKTLNSIDIENLINIKNSKEFKNTALSSFDRNVVEDFNYFDYTVKVLFSKCITEYTNLNGNNDKMYITILKIN